MTSRDHRAGRRRCAIAPMRLPATHAGDVARRSTPAVRRSARPRRAARRRSRSPGATVRRTGSPSCRWRAGTAPTTGGPPTSCAAAGQRFGASGAGLVWGGEAFAVRRRTGGPTRTSCASARRRPTTSPSSTRLLDPAQVTGLQLTHCGRWSVEPAPGRARRRSSTRRRTGPVLTDDELDAHRRRLRRRRRASREQAGFDFVDVKACHGYLLHELLSGTPAGPTAATSPAAAAAAHDHRAGARRRACRVGVRLSAFDVVPHRAGPDGVGEPEAGRPVGLRRAARAARPARRRPRLRHRRQPVLLARTCSGRRTSRRRDGYPPPEDPLVGVARLLAALRRSRRPGPTSPFVATGLTYLQEWVPHVASAVVARRRRRSGRPRAHGAQLPRPPGRRARRPPARRPPAVPHVQRLHDGAAQRARVGLLPARRRTTRSHPDRVVLAAAKRRSPCLSGRDGVAVVGPRHRADARVVVAADEGPLHRRGGVRRRRRRRRHGGRRAHRRRRAHVRRGAARATTSTSSTSARRRRCTSSRSPPRCAAGKHVVCEKPLVGLARRRRRAGRGRGREHRAGSCRSSSTASGNGLQKVKALVDAGSRAGVHVVGRGRVAAAGRLLRGAVARALGDRARRRPAQPGHPRPRHAHLHRRAAGQGVLPHVTTRVNDIEVEDCAAISLEMADGSLATVSATLGSPEEISRHRFNFANLSAESGTSAYESSADPWDITPDDEAAAAAIAAVLDGWDAAPRGLVGPVRALRRRPRRGRPATRHARRRPRVARADHRAVRLGPSRRRRRAAALRPTTPSTRGWLPVNDLWTYNADHRKRPNVHPLRTPSGARPHPRCARGPPVAPRPVVHDQVRQRGELLGGVRRVRRAPPRRRRPRSTGSGPTARPSSSSTSAPSPTSSSDDDAYAIDWDVTLTPQVDVVLDRTEFTTWGGYGGLALRGRGDWTDTRLLLADGNDRTSALLGVPSSGATSAAPSRAARPAC